MDFGDNAKRLYSEFSSALSESKVVKPSMEGFQKIIGEVVEQIKKAPMFDE